MKLIKTMQNTLAAVTFLVAQMAVMATANAFDDPRELLVTTTDTILSEIDANGATLKNDPKQLYAFVEKEIIPYVDVEYTSKLVLGRNWNAATDAQRQEFQKEFTSFLVKNYASGMFAYDGQKISFGQPEYNDDQSKAIVKATMTSGSDTIEGDMKLVKRANGWLIYNAEVQDINLVSNFRASYNEIIAKKGIDGLISDLRQKNAQYE